METIGAVEGRRLGRGKPSRPRVAFTRHSVLDLMLQLTVENRCVDFFYSKDLTLRLTEEQLQHTVLFGWLRQVLDVPERPSTILHSCQLTPWPVMAGLLIWLSCKGAASCAKLSELLFQAKQAYKHVYLQDCLSC